MSDEFGNLEGIKIVVDGPIAYVACSVNATEQNYAPIEKQLCTILFTCRKFHDFVFGQTTTIYTDHKLLVGIFGKPLHKLSPRLQHMWMHLLRNDLDIQWKPGREMFVPHALGHIVMQSPDSPCTEFDDKLEVSSILNDMPVSEPKNEPELKKTQPCSC